MVIVFSSKIADTILIRCVSSTESRKNSTPVELIRMPVALCKWTHYVGICDVMPNFVSFSLAYDDPHANKTSGEVS